MLGTGDVPEIVNAIAGAAAPLRFYRSSTLQVSPSTLQVPPSTLQVPPTLQSRPTYIYDADTPRHLATPRHYAYVKIAEGCDYKCAFCIIPTLRGAYRSRPSDSIVREARALASRGVKELLLISQDTTFYGVDRHERGALARLLRELNGVEGLEWIRLLYLYPTTIDDETLGAMADCDKVCKYIDLPLQHASNSVLKRMKRPGTRQKYDALLARIRDRVPGRRAPNHLHRRVSGRDRSATRRSSPRSSRSSGSITWGCSPIRMRKARPPSRWKTTCRRRRSRRGGKR